MTEVLSREHPPATSTTVHPIFQGNGFIDDNDIYGLVCRVMRDETSNATPLGGLTGRVQSGERSCFLVAIVNSIYTLFLKLWHCFRMSCSSDYHRRFTHAAELITRADLDNQAMLAAVEARREDRVRQNAATVIQTNFRAHRIQKAYNEFREATNPLKAALETTQRELSVCRENVRNQENILSAYIQDCNQSRVDEPKYLGHRIWRWLTGSRKLDAPRVDLVCQERFNEQFQELSITGAQGVVASAKQREQQLRAEVLELERQFNEQKTTFMEFCEGFSPNEEVSGSNELEIIDGSLEAETFQAAMFRDIAEKAHPQLAALLKMAFDKFKEEKVASWSHDETSNTYKIILDEPFQMWVPAVDDQGENPETTGGAVILFGHDTQGTIILKMDSNTHSIHFEGGVKMYFYVMLGFRNYHLVPIVSLQYLSDSDKIKLMINMGAPIGRQGREKSVRNFELNWRERGELVADYKAALHEKMQ